MITATLGLCAVFLVGGASLRNCGLACKLRKSSHNVHAKHPTDSPKLSHPINENESASHAFIRNISEYNVSPRYVHRVPYMYIEQLNSANFLCLSKHFRELVSAEIKSSHEGQKRENADSSISSSTQGRK